MSDVHNIYTRPVVQTTIQDPEVAKYIASWQVHKITEEEWQKILLRDAQFIHMYIPKL